MIWKQGENQQAVLDRVDYQVVGRQGTVISDGSFTVDLTSPSNDEVKQTDVVTDRFLAGLAS